jgi:hypothetical protein
MKPTMTNKFFGRGHVRGGRGRGEEGHPSTNLTGFSFKEIGEVCARTGRTFIDGSPVPEQISSYSGFNSD